MSINIKSENSATIEEAELLGTFNSLNNDGPEPTGGGNMEAEKRIRREIANSNERRRMQSINAGFQSLRGLLPHHEGEKLSKAAILQQTAEYIYALEQEKTRLLSQNCVLKRNLNQQEGNEAPPKRVKKETAYVLPNVAESSDEVIDTKSPEPVGIITVTPSKPNAELLELKAQLEHERRLRLLLEDQLRTLEAQVVFSSQVYQNTEEAVLVTLPEDMQVVSLESVPPVAQTQTVESCPLPISRSPSPQRLPRALEAAIKAEPKVEVERIPSPTPVDECLPPKRVYPNTSRQNLETIVEAIRHLEGDHLFEETTGKRGIVVSTTISPAQEVPLALTTKPKESTQRLLQVEMNPYLQFHPTVQQQQRPGVIVVKQHS